MTKSILLILSDLLSGFAAHAVKLAESAPADVPTPTTEAEPTPAETPVNEAPAKKTRAAKTVTPPAEPVKTAGVPLEQLQAAILPLVQSGLGQQVRDTITKYSAEKLSDIAPENHAAFLKDIEALNF